MEAKKTKSGKDKNGPKEAIEQLPYNRFLTRLGIGILFPMTDSSLLSWKIWTCAACKVKKRSPSCTMVQNCERWHTCACRVGGSGSSLELISFWTISRYFPHMEKLWKKKLKTVSVALFPNIGHIWRKCGKQSVLDNFSDIGHIWRKCQRKLQTSSTRPFNHTWKKI